MMNIKGIFAVSLIAMVAMVAGTHTSNAVAAIASQGYVDQQVGLVEEKIPAAITVDSALNSTSTNPVQNKVINTALAGKQATLSAAQLNAVNSGITSTKVSTYDGYNEKITAAQNAADDAATAAATAQSTASGKLSSISGETTGTGNVVTNVLASGSAVSATKGITAEETKNKVPSVRAVASATDTAYPSEKAVATALATKVNTSALSGYATIKALDAVENKALEAQSDASAAQNAADAKVATEQGTDAANKAVITNSSGTITTGTISSAMITDGTITNADIATDAAIAQSKISGLTTALAGKEVTSNKVTSANYDANVSNDTKYPTVKAVADAITASATTASDILTTTTVTSSGTGAVLTGVSVEDGKVTLQKGNVQIPSGGQNATSYVSIWVE